MNIWVWGRDYPTQANNMSGSFELEQAKMLAKQGHNVVYCALSLSLFCKQRTRGFNEFEEDDVSIVVYSHLFFPQRLNVSIPLFLNFFWAKVVGRVQEKHGLPDIIHLHYPTMLGNVSSFERLRKDGVRIVATEHWTKVLRRKLSKIEKDKLEYFLRVSEPFICVSESLKVAIESMLTPSKPIVVIPNIVSLDFNVLEETKESRFTFVVVSRLVSWKRIDVVIEQFKRAFTQDDSVQLIIVGAGPCHDALKKIANGDQRIVFKGIQRHKECARIMQQSHVLISYGKFETFSVPVIEGWTCGIPSIVVETAGVASYINNKNGITVIDSDPNELGSAMKAIVNRYSEYNTQYIKDYAYKYFSNEAVYRMLENAYQISD